MIDISVAEVGEASKSRARDRDTIATRFERQVEEAPDNLAIVTDTGSLSYRALDALAERVAARLRADSDTARPIAVLMEKGPLPIAAMLGAAKAGRIFIPLELAAPEKWLAGVVRDSGAGVLMTDRAWRDVARRIAEAEVSVVEADSLEAPRAVVRGDVSPDSPACIIYTSGSTGRPKGVVQAHRGFLRSLTHRSDAMDIRPDDRYAHLRSLAYSAGIKDAFLVLFRGACLVPYDLPAKGLAGLPQWLEIQRITGFMSTSSLFRTWLAALPGDYRFTMLRTISATAEPLYGADIIRAAKHLTGDWRIVHGLSSTETGAIANLVYRRDTPVPNGVLPVGRACPDTIIHLVKEDGTLAAAGETGEIVVTSRFVALGYWNDPAASDAAFRTDPADSRLRRYRSGDLGRWRADGTLEHLGRNNRKIKLRGYSVEPYEIECALLSLPGIRDATVIVSGEGQEARLVAYVVGPADRSSGPVIRGLLAERLPAHLIPAQVTILDVLPLTPRGKVDRNALPVVAFKASPVPMRPPSTATERTLTLIWQRYLKFEGVGVDDNFYDVGGTSLQAFLIFASIAQKLGHDLPPTTMLEAPTIALQAALLDRKGTASKASKLIAFREHGSQPPLFLVHAGFGEIAYGRELARHLRSDRPVYGVRPPALDGKERISRTLESIAADYLAELRTVQANGPYFLAGHSFGGWVAFEMACQLERQNESIGFVGLIDTYAKSAPKYRETAVPRLARHAKALHRRSLRSVADYVGTRAVKNFSFGVEAARLAALGWLPKNVGKWTIGLPSYAMRPDLYRRIHHRASRNYRPQFFGGRIVVFGAQGMAETHETHWSPLIRGGVTVVEIPAGHSSMVWPPHSETLAAAFDGFLGSTTPP